MTERLDFHFSLSCIGEGNGNPLQCSCLENPRDGRACGLPSMGSHRVEHDWSDLAAAASSKYFSITSFHKEPTLILKQATEPFRLELRYLLKMVSTDNHVNLWWNEPFCTLQKHYLTSLQTWQVIAMIRVIHIQIFTMFVYSVDSPRCASIVEETLRIIF